MPDRTDETCRDFRNRLFRAIRVDDVTPEMRLPNRTYGFNLNSSDWKGTDNGFYVYEDHHPGLLLHQELKYTLPTGAYLVRPNWREDYTEIIFTDVDVLTAPDEAFVARMQAIINSITT